MLKKVILSIFAILPFMFIGYVAFNPSITEKLQIYETPQVVQIANMDENRLFDLVQEWRIAEGYSKYSKTESVCDIATIRLDKIKKFFSHDGFKEMNSRHDYFGYNHLGENLIQNQKDEESALKGWLSSPLHLKNLKDDFTESCIRCEGTYCVQIFGAK